MSHDFYPLVFVAVCLVHRTSYMRIEYEANNFVGNILMYIEYKYMRIDIL